jgi:hypothetical protein
MAMFRNFRGRDAKIEPLLEKRGLTANQACSYPAKLDPPHA